MANARLTCHFRVSQTLPIEDWWRQTGSNRRPPACKAGALPAELCPHTETTQVSSRQTTWWVWLDSNQRPPPYQDGALTD